MFSSTLQPDSCSLTLAFWQDKCSFCNLHPKPLNTNPKTFANNTCPKSVLSQTPGSPGCIQGYKCLQTVADLKRCTIVYDHLTSGSLPDDLNLYSTFASETTKLHQLSAYCPPRTALQEISYAIVASLCLAALSTTACKRESMAPWHHGMREYSTSIW